MRADTIFEVSSSPKPAAVIRIDADLSERIKEIARQCLMTDAAVLSRIVRDALPYVKLVERKVFEMEGERE